MKDRKAKLEKTIEDKHDMEKISGPRSWEACGVEFTYRCSICGLTHKYGIGGQNTGSYSYWSDFDGNEITLADAAFRLCA